MQIAFTAVLGLFSFVSWGATLPGTLINNTATATYSGALTSTGSAGVTTAACTTVGINVEMLKDALGNTISAYASGQTIIVSVTSYDANTTAGADTLNVTLTTSGGDNETVLLTETGTSTGIFTGTIPSALGTIAADGIINVPAPNQTITATYTRTDCAAGAFTGTASALIDPYGFVFDSATGAPVNGASVSLVDALNNPVVVNCNDGVTPLTQPVTSGSPTNCDATMVAGAFRFPQIPAGILKIVVVPPASFAFPSAVAPAGMPATVGTPPAAPVILGIPVTGGSYGGTFTLLGTALKIDIPVDPGTSTMTIQKSVGKTVVSTGEFVPYTLTINNNTAAPLAGALIADRLPPGFRYQKGSARLDGAVIPDPAISADARTLTFSLNIAASATATVRYVLEVTPAARTGSAENTAVATGAFTSNTARASVVVREDLYRNKTILIGRVIDGSCDDNAGNNAKGLANARIVLEDGSSILTDQEGRWHIDNLRAGTHVVQLDLDSLPKDYEVAACEKNSRFAGRMYSQFVNLHGGTLWRADFHVQKRVPENVRITQTLSAQPANTVTAVTLALVSSADVTGYSATVMLPESAKYVPGSAKLNGSSIADPDSVDQALIFRSLGHAAHWQDQYTFDVSNAAPDATIKSLVRFTTLGRAAQNLPVASISLVNNAPASTETFAYTSAEAADIRPAKASLGDERTSLMDPMTYDAAWLASAQPGIEWLHPRENFFPALPTTKIAVMHAPDQRVEVTLNEQPVSAFHLDGTTLNSNRTVALSTWRGINLKDGANQLAIRVLDASGKIVKEEQRIIRYINSFDRVELDKEHSRLIADGKTRPIIAIRFVDKDGYPVRRGINGEFMLNEPYLSHDRREGIEREPLTGRIGGKPRFEVTGDGLAMIELEPTTQTGEAILSFQFNDMRKQEVRAWLEPGQRDWILVGFGEGTLGHKTLSGNIQELRAAEIDRELFDENKLAFYAKGSIRGDYLLTIAYDTAKKTGNKTLKQAVDPTQYYTLYADATQANFDAATSSRLYVKLERKQFYAMFGDYDTDLTVTELSRYSRTLNGVKIECKGETLGYSAFASVTAQAYVKDEIPGNGTSGVYKLTRSNLMVSSDKVRIETRDRFQSQNIVSAQSLTRYLDYDIDYNNGTLTFREPVNSRDGNFNPTYIIAEYESAGPADEKATLGGRGSIKATKDIEIGATVVHEGTVGARGNLEGIDVAYQLSEKTKVRAEAATTNRDILGIQSSGNAVLGEVTHQEEQWAGKAYVREQTSLFGMGQQASSETATRKMGVDARFKLSDASKLQGQAYQQSNVRNGTRNSVLEGRVDNTISDALSAYYGARTTHDQNAAGNTSSNQLLGGAAYTMLDKKLTLHSSAEISAGTAGSSTMPDRLIIGTDYKLNGQSKIFAEQEFARGEQVSANTTRAGIRTQPWMGNEMSASAGRNTNNDAERLYANLGMVQRWQINEHWQTNFSIDRSQTLRNTAAPLNNSTPLPSGSGGLSQLPSASGDYTAAAVAAAYHDTQWSSDGRIEIRNASLDQQRNLQFGAQRNLNQGRSVAAGYTLRIVDSAISYSRGADLRLSYAHRPNDSQWVWFDRADYITQATEAAASSLKGAKLVNNLNANYMPSRHTQLAMQYGAKYVLDRIDDTDYKGYTDLIGAEIRHDLTENWDIGTFGSVMRSHNSGVQSYGYGASVGYKLMDNIWVSAGYNARGMNDRDFAAGSYRAQGPYITLRIKVDQDTFGLNKGKINTRPITAE